MRERDELWIVIRLGVDDVVTWRRVNIYERPERWLSFVERDLSIYFILMNDKL